MRRIRVDCDCRAVSHPDAGTIDRLARLQLAVQREGSELRLVGAQPSLLELLDLCGLAEVLRVEAGRQAEKRGELGRVQEEGDLPHAAVWQLDHLQSPGVVGALRGWRVLGRTRRDRWARGREHARAP